MRNCFKWVQIRNCFNWIKFIYWYSVFTVRELFNMSNYDFTWKEDKKDEEKHTFLIVTSALILVTVLGVAKVWLTLFNIL